LKEVKKSEGGSTKATSTPFHPLIIIIIMTTSKVFKKPRVVGRKIITKKAPRPSSRSIRQRRTDHKDHCVREVNYSAACKALHASSLPNIAQVACDFGLDYHTLRRRYKGLTRAPKDAHAHQRLLSDAQTFGLTAWVRNRAAAARPVNQLGLRAEVKELIGHHPSRSWAQTFETTSLDITFSTANGLDPRRAACFNPTAINAHFDAIERALALGIKPHNIYNFDEQVSVDAHIHSIIH
jgi:hypothetical protein